MCHARHSVRKPLEASRDRWNQGHCHVQGLRQLKENSLSWTPHSLNTESLWRKLMVEKVSLNLQEENSSIDQGASAAIQHKEPQLVNSAEH